jgi:hypothetical protein
MKGPQLAALEICRKSIDLKQLRRKKTLLEKKSAQALPPNRLARQL